MKVLYICIYIYTYPHIVIFHLDQLKRQQIYSTAICNSKETTFSVDINLQSIIFRLTGNILFSSQANNLFELFSDQLFITMLISWPWKINGKGSWQLTVWIQSTFTPFAFPWASAIKPHQKEWALRWDIYLHKVWHIPACTDLVATKRNKQYQIL